jgi:alpha-galactosidase
LISIDDQNEHSIFALSTSEIIVSCLVDCARMSRFRDFILLVFCMGRCWCAQEGPAPPMGWNSWDSFGMSIREPEFKANADWMARYLKQYGWQYAVIDEGWYLQNPEAMPGSFRFTISAEGRYTPALNRFPSAANGVGFKSLADYVHALGLKFGIHIIRGIPREAVQKNLPVAGSKYKAVEAADQSGTCPWNADNYGVKPSPAGQAYYDSIANLYASWGVDFVKIDCISSHPYKGDEIRMFSQALQKTGRRIVLSLSPGPTPLEKAGEVRQWAQMWRISDDFWDRWAPLPKHDPSESLRGHFLLEAEWAPHTTGGHWPDGDMLPLGHLGPRTPVGQPRPTNFTRDEQRTVMTLWSIARSPLIMGGNLTESDSWTTSLLTNPEVIAVDQHSSDAKAVLNESERAIWTAKSGEGGAVYVALFNLADTLQSIQYPLQSLGLRGTSYAVRDLWERKDIGILDTLNANLQPHASMLYRVKQNKAER